MPGHKKKSKISIDPRSPIRIVKEIENNNDEVIVNYGKQYLRESKEYLKNNYPALVEDFELFKITGERFDEEFLQARASNLLQLQMYENPALQKNLELKNNKIKIKKQQKMRKYKQLNLLNIDLDSTFHEKNLQIQIKSNEESFNFKQNIDKLMKITQELQKIGYSQKELVVSFTKNLPQTQAQIT